MPVCYPQNGAQDSGWGEAAESGKEGKTEDIMQKFKAVFGVQDMTVGRPIVNLAAFSIPLLIGNLAQQMYNTVDAVIVGQFVGTQALAAVGGTVGTLINLLVGFFVGLSSGATVIIAQYWGSGDGSGVSKAVHTGIALSLAGGAVLTVVGGKEVYDDNYESNR